MSRWLLGAGLFYTACTAVLTWPLPVHLATHVRAAPAYGISDVHLHLWTLAWVSRTILRDPAGLFDANIFYPAPLTLAGSDHLLGTLPIAGPVYWLTGNPVAAMNAVVLASFPLAGLAAGALVRALGGGGWAGLLGGFVFAFAPMRMRSFVPVQMFTVQYLPLALLALVSYLRRGGGWRLGGGLVLLLLQLLVAYYLAYAALVAVGVVLLVVVLRERGVPPSRWARLAAGLVVVLAVTALVSLPYLLRHEGGAIPSYGGAFGTAGETRWMLRGFVGRRSEVYLGIVPVGLAVLGLLGAWRADRERRGAALVFLSIAFAGWVLCLGSHAEIGGVRVPLPYAWLAAVVPGFASMRVALRFFLLVILGVAGLAGMGLAFVRGRLGAVVAAAVLAAAVWQYRPPEWPLALLPMETSATMPAAHEWLRLHGDGGALLELPLGPEGTYRALNNESLAMYRSTHHWLPLLNGYTAYPPPSYEVLMRVARQLPEPESLDTLLGLADVRWILVHLASLWGPEQQAWRTPPGLQLAAELGTDIVLRVVQRPSADHHAALLRPEPGKTITGVSTAPLAPDARQARLEGTFVPRVLVAGRPTGGAVRVVNTSGTTWPGLAADDDGLVTLLVAWDGVAGEPRRIRLPRDLGPGEAVTLRFPLAAPGPPGDYRLRLWLVQAPNEAFPDATAPPLVTTISVTGTAAPVSSESGSPRAQRAAERQRAGGGGSTRLLPRGEGGQSLP